MATINDKITVKGFIAAGIKNPLKRLLHNHAATVAGIQAAAAIKAKDHLKTAKTARETFRFYYSQFRFNSVGL